MKSNHAITELEFRCAMCHDWLLLDHLAFTFMVSDEGEPIEREGVCGWCAAGEDVE